MEKMASKKGDSPRKLSRRRSRRRKPTQDFVINTTEARREVAHALHLHRSSASSPCAPKVDASMLDNSGNSYDRHDTEQQPSFVASTSQQYYCYSLTNTLPTPEPVWSTTAPSVLAVSPPVLEAQEFEGAENQAAASYSWWIGFLKNLDSNATGLTKNRCADYNHNNRVKGCSTEFGQCQNVSTLGETPELTETSDQNSCTDEWFNVSNY